MDKTKRLALLLGIAFVVIISGYMLIGNALNTNPFYKGRMMGPINGDLGPKVPGNMMGRDPGTANCPCKIQGNLEVSEEYIQKVKDILNKDSDVKNLLNQGYNITSIQPVIKRIVGADGTVTSKATTAIVKLTKVASGFATVNVDVELGKVIKIQIVTRTVIDKTG
ncbi:hypothetical protein FJY84_05510 [Candidatus Bathyarchaeota archaeon]|nr:hypothetical protein [Candidatus Bathyarchaeota archaeon]